jgi:hypothetical protein
MTGTSPGRRSGKVLAANEMPGIHDKAGSYAGRRHREGPGR